MSNKKLLIVGTGGQSKVVLDCALKMDVFHSIYFLTDNNTEPKQLNGYPVINEKEITIHELKQDFDEVIIAIGNNNIRLSLSLKYLSQGIKLATLLHPNATISTFAKIDCGTVVFSNAVINPGASIGKACIINTGAIIEHDCTLEDGVHMSPNSAIAGAVSIGERSWLCIGSNVANNITIGKNSIIAAGAVVLNDFSDNAFVTGIPAKLKKQNK